MTGVLRMKVFETITELIGRTPLLDLSGKAKGILPGTTIYAKLECFNPAGSSKDRVAREMIEDAKRKGLLKPGSVIIEPTSGNTGIGLAAVAAEQGYRVILTMPETMSIGRRNLLKAYGAEIVRTDGAKGMTGQLKKHRNCTIRSREALSPGSLPIRPMCGHILKRQVLRSGKIQTAWLIFLWPVSEPAAL